MTHMMEGRGQGGHNARPRALVSGFGAIGLGLFGLGLVVGVYNACKIEVGTGMQAVLIRKTGLDLEPDMELAPPPRDGRYYKGVQTDIPGHGLTRGVLTEGRYFYNPFYWSWEVSKQMEIPDGKIGIRVALDGKDLGEGHVLAEPGEKGILREVLKPGRYPNNWYAETIELHDVITVPAGFRGVKTLLAGKNPRKMNDFLVTPGERGVQPETLEPGTYYLNPYETRVSLVDCRSKRFNLGQDGEMDFLSADGFPITLDGAVEFRVIPEKVADVFVKYNEDENGDEIDEEIIAKIITPESRALCRIGGSKLTGGQFISGEDREKFQRDLVVKLTENCKKQGIEILSVAITSIQPPEAIAEPVRAREVAKQQLAQYRREKEQQLSEAELRVETILADQKKKLVEAEQSVVEKTTKAEQEKAVAKTLAEQKLAVAGTQFEATKDKAAAITAKAEAEAEVIRFNNTAEVAGLTTRVAAFQGDGAALARNILLGKLAPGFRSLITSSDGPLMDLFAKPHRDGAPKRTSPPSTASPTPSHSPAAPERATTEPTASRMEGAR